MCDAIKKNRHLLDKKHSVIQKISERDMDTVISPPLHRNISLHTKYFERFQK